MTLPAREVKMKSNPKSSEKETVEEEISLQDDESVKEDTLQKSVEENRKEYLELHDQYLRLAADFDNFKKRVAKEKSDLISFGNEELIKSLLSVLDNLERGIHHSETIKDSEPIIEGIILVHKQFLGCLEKFGVKKINVNKADEFDPRIHQAVERVESNEVKPGLIISELLKGYILNDRLLRPALVSVSIAHSEPTSVESESDETQPSQGKTNGRTRDMSQFIDEDVENK